MNEIRNMFFCSLTVDRLFKKSQDDLDKYLDRSSACNTDIKSYPSGSPNTIIFHFVFSGPHNLTLAPDCYGFPKLLLNSSVLFMIKLC